MPSMPAQRCLVCPLTLQLFIDPVTTPDGYTFERDAIMRWINENGTNPITKKPLHVSQLSINDSMRNIVKDVQGESTFKTADLAVICLHCGSPQKLDHMKDHNLTCASKRTSIEQFEIAENETASAVSLKKATSRIENLRSFSNPLADRTINPANIINPSLETDIRSTTDQRCSLKKRHIKCFVPIILFLILAGIVIALTIHSRTSETDTTSTVFHVTTTTSSSTSTRSTTATSTPASTSTYSSTSISSTTVTLAPTSTSTFSSTKSTTSTSTSSSTFSSTSTSTATPQTLCDLAEWILEGITVASNLYDPYDMAVDEEGNMIVADTEHHRLLKYFGNSTNVTLVPNTKITSVVIDKFGDIYFTDTFGDAVKKLDSLDGSIATVAGGNGPGSKLDQLVLTGHPTIYVDRNLSLYVSDTGNDRVMKYDRNATSGVVVAGGHGRGPESGQLNTPNGIYVDEIIEVGAIYICDSFNRRIQKWLPSATEGITVAYSDTQLNAPISIQLAPTSNQTIVMYISSFNREKVFKWIPYADQAEAIVAGTGGFGSNPNQLESPRGIKFDSSWNLFVADTGNNRIQKFLFNTSSC